jgi:hypothetical protein
MKSKRGPKLNRLGKACVEPIGIISLETPYTCGLEQGEKGVSGDLSCDS